MELYLYARFLTEPLLSSDLFQISTSLLPEDRDWYSKY